MLVNLRPDANIVRIKRFRFSFRFRHFETFLCQLDELQSKEIPGCLMNLWEKDGSERGALSLKTPAK